MTESEQSLRLSNHSIARKQSAEAQELSNGSQSTEGTRAANLALNTNQANSTSMEDVTTELEEQRKRQTPSVPQKKTKVERTMPNPTDTVKLSSEASTHSVMLSPGHPVTQQSNLDIDPDEGRRKRKKITPESKHMSIQKDRTSSLQQQLLSAAFGPTSTAKKTTTGPPEAAHAAPPISDNESTKQSSADIRSIVEKTQRPVVLELDAPRDTAPIGNGGDQYVGAVAVDSQMLQVKTPPKKMMKLRMDGKLGSPKETVEAPARPRRGRKPAVVNKERMVVLRYGCDRSSKDAVGQKIATILSGTIRIPRVPGKDDLKASKKQTIPPKETHPFFLGQTKPQPTSEVSGSSQKLGAHSSPRKKAIASASKPWEPWPTFTSSPSRLKSSKSPSSFPPPWPTGDMAHVRSLDETILSLSLLPPIPPRKLKDPAVRLNPNEDVLTNYTRKVRQDNKSARFRKPTRRILTGTDLRRTVTREIYGSETARMSDKPSIQRFLDILPMARSAFDRFECDHQDWATKYAPKCSADVLQNRRPIELFRDWLLGHTVNAVDCGDASERRVAPKRRKKRRRSSDLDGFVVSTDDDGDVDQPDHFYDTDQERPREYHKLRQTNRLRELSAQNTKNTGAVIITGPHGCGKTATIYAVAQELEFEIFEVNPGSRRSGRDLLERVGDMTRNHLVNRLDTGDDTEMLDSDGDEDPRHVQDEIDSGRQSTMGAFFKPKVVKKPQGAKTVRTKKAATPVPIPKKIKSQKQSLILLEEVDVLFEEDKNFWNTVVSLLVSSRRPVVMTCTDETLLPIDQLDTCSILHLYAPQSETAISYLMLLAAHEGHIISRKAVNQLYKCRPDLRYSISQLQFWCQMALKDPKGGLGWMLSPPDMSTPANTAGDPIRVISEGTYLPCMGGLSRNDPTDSDSVQDQDVDLMREALDEWSCDIEWLGMSNDWPSDPIMSGDSTIDSDWRLQNLRSVDTVYEAMSGVDVMLGSRLSSGSALESSHDALTDKARSNYTTGYHLLEASHLQDDTNLSKQIAAWLKFNAKIALFGSEATLDRERQCSSTVASGNTRDTTTITYEDLIFSMEPLAPFQYDSSEGKPYSILASESRLSNIATDIAPYVRSIVTYDVQLEQDRLRLSNILSEGGRPKGKKLRTTRASRAALEGGNKASTRRERWFPTNLNFPLVLDTAGEGWQEALRQLEEKMLKEHGAGYRSDRDEMLVSSQDSTI
ncbi:hypothetical protein MMC10_008873 [Thelotrema lepadinum]|nr:hypothetical protein [Thelotrema lepadinum]